MQTELKLDLLIGANRCLIASATKNNFRYIAVVLGAQDTDIRFGEAEEVLEYCFDEYEMTDISNYLKFYINISVTKGNIKYYEIQENYNLSIPLKKGEYEKIYVKQDLIKNIEAPLTAGSKIGTVTAYIGEEIIFEENIYLKKNIKKTTVLDYFNLVLKDIFIPFETI